MTVEQFRKLAAKPRRAKRKSKAEHALRFASTPMATETEAERTAQRQLFEIHDAAAWGSPFRLPFPPTINQYRAIFQPPKGRARLITSAEGRAYREAVATAWNRIFMGTPPKPLRCKVRLLIVWHFPRNGKNDGSNRLKALEDALAGLAYENDSQIDDERWRRGPVVKGTGAADITIEIISEAQEQP